MKIEKLIVFMKNLAKQDCYCNKKAIRKCYPCEAAGILNEISEILKEGYEEFSNSSDHYEIFGK